MILQANGIDIFYERLGEGRPFLLLHGNGEDHSRFSALAPILAQDFEVFALDTRCHGKSSTSATLGYLEMMEDVAAFISVLALEKPLLLGASDGGITGILLAIRYPEMLSGLIACGANTHFSQLRRWFILLTKLGYLTKKDPKLRLMLTEPNISHDEMARIKTPVLVLAGTRDIVSTHTTREIAQAIPGSELKILEGETHDSYLVHHERLLEAIKPFLTRI
ncbi:MAG: alpha/beta hydrolase [Eggerthellaceae bacterium]|nr:alpha/beta hydrolase [Eggerthellaceae bacterium]